MVLYPPFLALLADFTCDLEEIAGLAASLGTSAAQFMSFGLSVPGMHLASVNTEHMMLALAAVLLASQLLCFWLSLQVPKARIA